MFFVYKQSITKREVIGGTVSVGAAKKLAKKRAKQNLIWKPVDGGYDAEILQGKVKIFYQIRGTME